MMSADISWGDAVHKRQYNVQFNVAYTIACNRVLYIVYNIAH